MWLSEMRKKVFKIAQQQLNSNESLQNSPFFSQCNIFDNSNTYTTHSTVQPRKWSPTGNDPQIGPQMIPNRK